MNSKLSFAPRIGMGCWAIGGPFWNGDIPVGYSGSDDAESRRTIRAAFASGVRVLTTVTKMDSMCQEIGRQILPAVGRVHREMMATSSE